MDPSSAGPPQPISDLYTATPLAPACDVVEGGSMRILLVWCVTLLSSAVLGGAFYQVVLSDPQPQVIAGPEVVGRTSDPIPTPTITRTEVRTVVRPTPTITIEEVVPRLVSTAARASVPAPQRTAAPTPRRTSAPKPSANRQVTEETARAHEREGESDDREDSSEREAEAAKEAAEREREAAKKAAEREAEAAKEAAEHAAEEAEEAEEAEGVDD